MEWRSTSPDYRVLALDMALTLNEQRKPDDWDAPASSATARVLADAEAFCRFLEGAPVAEE